MSTIAQTINERHIRGHEVKHRHEERGTLLNSLENVGLFLLTPVIGLGYAVGYGLVGMAAVFCYGLKAFGIRCGVFKG